MINHPHFAHVLGGLEPEVRETFLSTFGEGIFCKSEEESPPNKITRSNKVHLSKVFLNNFCCVPDPFHREAGRSSHKPVEKVHVNAFFWGYFGASSMGVKNLTVSEYGFVCGSKR